MAYTRAQWEALQNRLPEEDRVSYDEYLRSIGRTFASPTPTAAKESGTIVLPLYQHKHHNQQKMLQPGKAIYLKKI
jgi:hypothetical protein